MSNLIHFLTSLFDEAQTLSAEGMNAGASTASALVAAIAAVAAWRAARRSHETAKTVASIEAKRWHIERTPQFELSARKRSSTSDHVSLKVKLVGPIGMEHLDSVQLSIRDDRPRSAPTIAGGPTAKEVAATVWGPYRFVSGVDGADDQGRSAGPVGVEMGNTRLFALEPTISPPWQSSGFWAADYANAPVRLRIECRRCGEESWTVHRDIAVEPAE